MSTDPTGINNSTPMTFARIAKDYDRFNTVSSLGIHHRWRRKLVRDVLQEEPQRILDVAGGTGAVSMALALALPHAEITLSDISPEMLAVARERISESAARPAFANIRTVLADAQSLPFEDNSYDVITCAYGIRNMSDRPRALAEFYRVLKPGGALLVMEFSTPPSSLWRGLYHCYLRFIVPMVGGRITGNRREFEYLRESILAFPSQQTFSEMLEAAGFTDIYHSNLTGGIVAIHNGTKPDDMTDWE
jgi:demethylmenaquinone methyltransferase/2-methoxy-6-polyprenyl-1,4-benzoquinol methylase